MSVPPPYSQNAYPQTFTHPPPRIYKPKYSQYASPTDLAIPKPQLAPTPTAVQLAYEALAAANGAVSASTAAAQAALAAYEAAPTDANLDAWQAANAQVAVAAGARLDAAQALNALTGSNQFTQAFNAPAPNYGSPAEMRQQGPGYAKTGMAGKGNGLLVDERSGRRGGSVVNLEQVGNMNFIGEGPQAKPAREPTTSTKTNVVNPPSRGYSYNDGACAEGTPKRGSNANPAPE
jgi:hypothetical protein